MNFWRTYLAPAAVAAMALLFAWTAAGGSARAEEYAEPEEWIFEVLKPPFLIADGVFVYQHEDRYYLPAAQLARGFEFFAETDSPRDYVRGWFVDPENTFMIDAARREVTVKGERRALDPLTILESGNLATDDVYVQLEVLNDIWPVTMNINLAFLSITVETDQPLAFEQRLARGKQRELALARTGSIPENLDIIDVDNDYRWLGRPVMDAQTQMLYDDGAGTLTGNATFSGAQQFLGTLADYSASFGYDRARGIERPSSIRLRLQRQSFEEGGLFGTGIRNVEGGDVNLRQRDLVDNGIGGRGVFFSTFDSKRDQEFDLITVEGSGPPGWEVELYNNSQLIDFGLVEDNGEYRFEDVLLRFGNNRIRAVFYGPQGQQREEVRDYNFGAGMLREGEFGISGGFADADRPLIYLDNSPRTQPRGIAANTFMSYGIAQNFTGFVSASQVPVPGNDLRHYGSAGLAFTALGGAGQAEAYTEAGGGNAFDLRFLTDILGIKLNLRTSIFNRLESPEAGFGANALRFEGDYQANKNVSTSIGALGLRLGVLHRETRAGLKTTVFSTQQSLSRGGLRLSNDTSTRLRNERHDRSTGRITATSRFGNWQLRGNANYQVYPAVDLTSLQSELRYKTGNDFQAAISARRNFLRRTSGVGGQVGYDFGKVLGSMDADYEQDRGWQFMLRASASLHPYDENEGYAFSSRAKKSVAPLRSHVFLDRNRDGVFNADDEPVEGVKMHLGNARSREATGGGGYVVDEMSASAGATVVRVDEATLGDPYFKPAVDGYRVVPLPGNLPTLEFPVIETGSIDGTVYYAGGGPLPGLTLQLVNEAGDVAMTNVTAFDGFYLFEYVPPGTYTVRADPAYGVAIPPETVTVPAEDPFVYGIDMRMAETAPAAGWAASLPAE